MSRFPLAKLSFITLLYRNCAQCFARSVDMLIGVLHVISATIYEYTSDVQ